MTTPDSTFWRTTCPICRRRVRLHRDTATTLAHLDKSGQLCPMSGQPLGALPQ